MQYLSDNYILFITEVMAMIAEKIKLLRESKGMTQTDIAKKLGITRSSVNAWEMGISIPSTQYIVELALLFNVSSDYILGIPKTSSINIEGLSEKEVSVIAGMIECLKENHKKESITSFLKSGRY